MTTLISISSSQAQKEVTANENFIAVAPAGLFARKYTTTSGLTWGYLGGILMVDGVLTTIADGTVSLSASATNYIEATRAGVVSKNTTGFTAGQIPLYSVVTGASSITSYTDYRLNNFPLTGRLSKSVAGGSDVTLTAAEARNQILDLSGALTANINVIVPTVVAIYAVYNGTSGAFTLTVKTAAGTGVAVTQGSRGLVYCDGTSVFSIASGGGGGGSGDVVGPASSTDNTWPRYDGTTGKLIQAGTWVEADSTGAVTAGGDLNMVDKIVQRPELKDYAETSVAANSGTAYTIDLESGNVFEITLTGNCTFTFSNPPATGKAGSFTLILKQDGTGSRTATWPAAVKWAGGVAPTLTTTASKTDILSFVTRNAGTDWYGFVGGKNF